MFKIVFCDKIEKLGKNINPYEKMNIDHPEFVVCIQVWNKND